MLRDFVKLNKIKKSEKNAEVGGWVKHQLGFFFFGEILCFLCCFLLLYMGGAAGLGLANPSFFRIFRLFQLDKTP